MKPRHFPLTFLFFTALGAITSVVGVAALAGWMRGTHPLLNDDMAGWALIVTAVALFLTGGFPLVLRRLAEREGA